MAMRRMSMGRPSMIGVYASSSNGSPVRFPSYNAQTSGLQHDQKQLPSRFGQTGLLKDKLHHVPTDLVYLYGEIVLEHLRFFLQEVHYVLGQAFFRTVLFGPAALLRIQSQHGEVIKRRWCLNAHDQPQEENPPCAAYANTPQKTLDLPTAAVRRSSQSRR